MKDPCTIDVLICGAGAAGLTLGIDLARRGLTVRVIEKRDCPFPGARGKGIQPRTQEVFEDLGILDRIVASGGTYPLQRQYRADGSFCEQAMIVDVAPTADEPYHIALMVPQFRTEQVMRERLAELGHYVEFGCELVGFEQDGDRVMARLERGDGEELVHARYLVGADGGRSFVRGALGVGFPGETLGVRALVAEVLLTGLDRAAIHRFNDGDMARQIMLTPLVRTDLFQIQAPIPLDGETDLSLEALDHFLADRIGRADVRVVSVSWASTFAMNARLADAYRVGRIFLAGDAAHIHPPTGGQGLNTSVQDAYNLGWKLAAVLAGAPDALLDSYEAERRPIAAGMLGLATGLLEKARRGDIQRGREVRQLDLGYRGSPLATEGKRLATIAPGDRMPDAVLVGAGGQARRLFDLLAGPNWTLLFAGDQHHLPALPRRGLTIWSVGSDGALRDPDRRLGLAEGQALLIRPDGYVGGVFDSDDAAPMADYLARVLPASRSKNLRPHNISAVSRFPSARLEAAESWAGI